ncbi:MAG: Ig-like domain-containing protein [Patescibacteria group bacterium]
MATKKPGKSRKATSQVRKKSVKKTAKKSSVKTSAKATASVSLPNTMPKRSVERAYVLRKTLVERVDGFMIATARYAGVFFVVAGGLFTLVHFDAQSTIVNIAQVSPGATENIDCTDPQQRLINLEFCQNSSGTGQTTNQNAEADAAAGEVVIEPEVSFAVELESSTSGDMLISVVVENAGDPRLFIVNVATQQTLPLSQVQQSGETYVFRLEAAKVSNEEYTTKLLVNQNGTVYEFFGPSITVENETEPVSTDDEEVVVEGIADTVETNTSEITIVFSAKQNRQISGDFTTSVTASGADLIELYLRDPESQDLYAFTVVETDDDRDLWQFTFDTTTVDDGLYRLLAKAMTGEDSSLKTGVLLDISNQRAVAPQTDNATTSETAASSTANSDEQIFEENAQASLSVTLDESSPVSGMVRVRAVAEDIQFIELYAVPVFSTTPSFLGLFQREQGEEWRSTFDSQQLPNGDYRFRAVARSGDEIVSETTEKVTIQNIFADSSEGGDDSVVAPVPKEVVDTITTIVETVSEEFDLAEFTRPEPIRPDLEDSTAATRPNERATTNQPTFVLETTTFAEEVPEVESVTERLLDEYAQDVDAAVRRLISAYRSGDQGSVERAQEQLTVLRGEIVEAALEREDTKDLIALINQELAREFEVIEQKTEKVESIVRERTAEQITIDTDQDGITDYDEITIYNTDPLVADSDNDGFIDGAEIISGFNPTDASPEAVMRFESPQETGIVREDLLRVDAVEAVVEKVPSQDGVPAQAEIRGIALPNSFITLYVFSTPTIVTIKTEADGSWVYRFDKELEDGEHEVYVGVTDNAGRIVAKSNPFTFVKEAQAFTPVDAAQSAVVTEEPVAPLTSTSNLTAVVSIAVVAIGLVLILIGWNMDATRPRIVTGQAEVEPA